MGNETQHESELPPHQDDDPLFGDTRIGELRMVLQCKAIVAAKRHLFHDHGLMREQLSKPRSLTILRWHLDAHHLSEHLSALMGAIPWGIRGAVHELEAMSSGNEPT